MFRLCFLASFGLLLSASALIAQTPNPAPAPAATEANDQEKMEDPQVGDHWTYEVHDDISGEVKSTTTNTITDISATDISIRTSVLGKANFGYTNYDHSWNRTSNDTWQFTPNDGSGIRLPLAAGKTWSAKASDVNRTTGFDWRRTIRSKVVAQESLTTRAGTFETFKIEITFEFQSAKNPSKRFQEVEQGWYAPAVDHWVKQATVTRSDGRVRSRFTSELIEYGRL
ncbi:hypothetical protein [Bradyrhizobium sp.]|jgi:hypothetical protein|uniref:hypothetical protein n=1 Tax=Bradyrhizobium sp. TaxID=376 RepID=UPI003C66FF95